MPPKIPEIIVCESNEAWEHELRLVAEGLALDESEDTWEHIARAIQRLNALAKGSATDYPKETVAAVRTHVRPIISALNSERTRLTGTATDLVVNLATQLGRHFGPLLPHLAPTLLGLATRTNKLLISRAKSCLLAIAEHAQLPNLFPLLRDAVTDKSMSLRLVASEVSLKCLNCFDPSDLETNARAEDIESIIRSTARDASADVRKVSRSLFEAYKILLPQRVATFVDPLSPVMKKYLDIKSKDTIALSSSSSNLQTNLQKSSRPFSASSSSIPADRRSADPVIRVHGHVKSLTIGSLGPMREVVAGPSAITNIVPSNDTKPQRTQGTGPMRPPPHMRHAILSKPAQDQGIRPAPSRFPSRPESAQSSHSMPPPPEPNALRERAKRPPRPESVPPPQISSDSKSKSAVSTVVHDKAQEMTTSRPESSLSQSGGFQKTSSSATGDFAPKRVARRVKKVNDEAESKISQVSKVRDAQKTSGRDLNSKTTVSSKAREVSASGPKEAPKRMRSEKINTQTKASSDKLSAPVQRNHSRAAVKAPSIATVTLELPAATEAQKPSDAGVLQENTVQKPQQPPVHSRAGIHAPTISQLAKRKALPPSTETNAKVQKKTKRIVEPLAILKINRPPLNEEIGNDIAPTTGATTVAVSPAVLESELVEIAAAAETPLPESPPSSASQVPCDDELPIFRLDVPPLPTPLRDVNVMQYRMAATPISALLFSIEQGFEDSLPEGSSVLDIGHLVPPDKLKPRVELPDPVRI